MLTLFSNKKIIFLIFLILLSIYKSQYIFFNGRFIAEEGSFWFRNAFLYGNLEGLTQVFVGSGYFNLWPNIASVFANLVPIEFAPLMTVYFAFVVKLYLFLYILFQKSSFLETDYQKYIAALIVLVSPPMVAEIWLNTLASQVYFTIISTLILFQINDESFFSKFSPVVLFIASLSTVTTCLLTPFFLKNFLKKKDKINFYNFFVIFMGSLVQISIYTYTLINNLQWGGANERYILSLSKLINYIYNVIFKSFFGTEITKILYFSSIENIYVLIILIAIFIILFFLLVKSFKILSKDKVFLILLTIFILQSLLAIYAGKDNHVQGRFAAIPGIMCIYLALRIISIKNSFKFVASILIFISISAGFYEFKHNNKYPHFLICQNCPHWKEEIAKWKQNKNYELKIWHYPRKSMSLSKN